MKGREKVQSIRTEKEVVVVHDGEPVPLVHRTDRVVEGHGLDVEGGEDGLLVGHGGVVVRGDLGREDDAHVAEVDVDRPQVCPAERRPLQRSGQVRSGLDEIVKYYVKYRDLGKVLQSLPLSPEVLHTAQDHDVLQLVVVEVGGPEGHHEVPEANERTLGVSEEADDDVTVEDRHSGLVPILEDSQLRERITKPSR